MSAKKKNAAKVQKRNLGKAQKVNKQVEARTAANAEIPETEMPAPVDEATLPAPEFQDATETPTTTEGATASGTQNSVETPTNADATMSMPDDQAPIEAPATGEDTKVLAPNAQVSTETAATDEQRTAPASEATPTTEAPAKTKTPKAKAEPKPKKVSAIDAAAKVLGEGGQPMTCMEMVEAMAKKGYWSSPNGATPQATLYSAILREIKTKGMESRFEKTERGRFAAAK